MIKNIVFDFGAIFINLDKEKFALELQKLGISQQSDEVLPILHQYEMGLISTEKFTAIFEEKLGVSTEEFTKAWNAILLDFPKKRLNFIQELAENKKYRLFLLSNTNDLHISWIQNNWGTELYDTFKKCFEQFYLSHEINLRKPNIEIYNFVLETNHLIAQETLFIDDTKENTEAAKSIGIEVWHLIPEKEDIVELFTKNSL
ncbi:putative haloacid dehalogenase-type hydrolase [Polaribacter irgensii 23-P]|uniref:Putative haloacid dehalogenase-type hydrolase n=1 Tax=Polaribacter irgensii 23-P TaxID=313594 RepID=A4C2P0_9FLAO|nr:HAD family phosphatase [Polaribacter irgensii]EAR11564.1 putative haloacid dehalogenase-type hydrolase [Polaribacter irgensii 23-P]